MLVKTEKVYTDSNNQCLVLEYFKFSSIFLEDKKSSLNFFVLPGAVLTLSGLCTPVENVHTKFIGTNKTISIIYPQIGVLLF